MRLRFMDTPSACLLCALLRQHDRRFAVAIGVSVAVARNGADTSTNTKVLGCMLLPSAQRFALSCEGARGPKPTRAAVTLGGFLSRLGRRLGLSGGSLSPISSRRLFR